MTPAGPAAAPGQALPKVHAHPQDEAEKWLAETYEPDDASAVGYGRSDMIDAYQAGWERARELTAAAVQREYDGRHPDGCDCQFCREDIRDAMRDDEDDFAQDRHADLDPGDDSGMTDADYYDRTAGAADSWDDRDDADRRANGEHDSDPGEDM